jgi:hypothetical protein
MALHAPYPRVETNVSTANSWRTLQVTVLVLLALAAGAAEGGAQVNCHPVEYHVGQDWIAKGGSIGSVQISVRPSEHTLDNLLCLLSTLRREHPEWTDVVIVFFDWAEAADRYHPGWTMADFGETPPPFHRYEQHLLAFYSLEAGKREQYLTVMPFGWQNGSETYASRLDLTVVPPKPRCRVGLKRRCLMSAVSETERVRVRGVVTLRARITAEGRVVDVVVEQARSVRPEQREALINAAQSELQSWRLDRAKADESVRVSYAYVPEEEIVDVETQIELPNGAIVRELSTK